MDLAEIWKNCLLVLEEELPAQQFNAWLRPLQASPQLDALTLYAPNRFVQGWVKDRHLDRLQALINDKAGKEIKLSLEVGTHAPDPKGGSQTPEAKETRTPPAQAGSRLNPLFTFELHIEGKSNQLARAAARQVGENPGRSYNPLFIYGGVGLGKTHLMQAAGHLMQSNTPGARVVYVHSERFVADMVKALRHNTINEFKKYYRNAHALLIDDIQFFVGKERSQEEFFHTFNELYECGRQIILTADKFPKELTGIEERLISRFGSGLVVSLEPPELETRVAILMKKAVSEGIELPEDVSFFIAKRVRANVRELEGALRRVVASSTFTGRPVSMGLALESLKDLMAFQDRMVTTQNIQRTVAEYYKIRLADLHSKERSRSIARPRQLAMALSKELTNHSLPEIGEAFGGRDHTTVIHACKKIAELYETDARMKEDYDNLMKLLNT